MTDAPLLEVDGLYVRFDTGKAVVPAVAGVSFTVAPGEAVGIVGESGSGKSVTARSILGLVEREHLAGGAIRYRGTDLLGLDANAWRRIRGPEIALVPQNALAALNPVFSVGWQIAELFRMHAGASRRSAQRKAISAMERVGIPAAARRYGSYPHEFSGGMRQRIMIAMAVALNPRLVIADEPTTALDVTVEAEVMDLFAELRRDTGMALIHITHDVGLALDSVDGLMVMYAGRVVETAPCEVVERQPAHPYTRALLESRPSMGGGHGELLPAIPGTPPRPTAIPSGCPFHPRCGYRRARCSSDAPPLRPVGPERLAACHYAEDVLASKAPAATPEAPVPEWSGT
jgi:oligopeptide transport system ATP-binding protein